MYFNAFPSTEFMAHLNSGAIGEPGDAGLALDVEFSGDFVRNDTVNKIAQIITEAVGLYKDTDEDVILPSYIYKDFLKGDIATLTKDYGANLDQKLENMKSVSQAAAEAQATAEAGIVTDTSMTVTPKTNEDTVQGAIDVSNPYPGPVQQ